MIAGGLNHMPTYAYECGECGSRQERIAPMSKMESVVACSTCGSSAQQVINWEGHMIAKGNQREFKLDALTCRPVGWQHGNTDCDKQEARYAKIIRREKKIAQQNDKQMIKSGFRKIATVPREMHRARTNQFGKDYFNPSVQSPGEIKQKLKEDGLLFKD